MRRSTTFVGATAAFYIRTSSAAVRDVVTAFAQPCRPYSEHAFFGGYVHARTHARTHARLLQAFKRRISGWSSLTGVPEICKV